MITEEEHAQRRKKKRWWQRKLDETKTEGEKQRDKEIRNRLITNTNTDRMNV